MPDPTVDSHAVLEFWFGADDADPAARSALWFRKDDATDAHIRATFGDAIDRALRGDLDDWAQTARGRLALVLLLDQLTRNSFRNDPRSYDGDARAQRLALDGIARGEDRELGCLQRAFLYMPLMHAEDLALQNRCVALFEAMAAEAGDALRQTTDSFAHFARLHRDVIARFGRFPHRNDILGRASTGEEIDFLRDGGPTF